MKHKIFLVSFIAVIAILFMSTTTMLLSATPAKPTITPVESKPGVPTVYTLHVSNDRDVPMVDVALRCPVGMMFPDYKLSYIGLPSGWTYTTARPGMCDACLMRAPDRAKERIVATTPDGVRHWSCNPMCMLKLVQKYDDLYIETLCDDCDEPISIEIENRKIKSVEPEEVYVILGGKVTGKMIDNKIACGKDCANPLAAKVPGAPVMPIAMALKMAKEMPLPTFHPTEITWRGAIPPGGYQEFMFVAENPVPEGTYAWTVTQRYIPHRCEVCPGPMLITDTMKERIVVTTPDGVRHWSCCPMCSLMLANTTNFGYPKLHIETLCDDCNESIFIDIENGAIVDIDPDEVYVIVGKKITGKCTDNKIACGKDCADALAAKGPAGAPVMPIAMALKMAMKMYPWKPGMVPRDTATYMSIPETLWITDEYTLETTVTALTALEKNVEEAHQCAQEAEEVAESATSVAEEAASKAEKASTAAVEVAMKVEKAEETAHTATTMAKDAASKAEEASKAVAEVASTVKEADATAKTAVADARAAMEAVEEVRGAGAVGDVAVVIAIIAIIISIVAMIRRPKAKPVL